MYDFSGLPELTDELRVQLPDPREASDQGIVGVGGNLSPGMLLSAYEQGLFPWYSPGEPVLWWSPDPRFVLFPHELHISRRTLRSLRSGSFRVSADRSFPEVIAACAEIPRRGEDGTWITDEMIDAYIDLHDSGAAHSIEVWDDAPAGTGDSGADPVLVGGLYGVNRGSMFCGESMFARRNDASKLALLALVYFLHARGASLIDSQVSNPHMERLGCRNIPRESYLLSLRQAVQSPDLTGWDDLNAGAVELVDWYEGFNADTSRRS